MRGAFQSGRFVDGGAPLPLRHWVKKGLIMGVDQEDGGRWLLDKAKGALNLSPSATLTDLRRAFLCHGNKVNFTPTKGKAPSVESIIYDRPYSVNRTSRYRYWLRINFFLLNQLTFLIIMLFWMDRKKN